jgi:hypothetical protein
VATTTAAPPAAADAASVGQPMATDSTATEDPAFKKALHSAFLIQAARPQEDAVNANQVRDSMDPSEDFCPKVGAADELGGSALEFAHCPHQDANPAPVPIEQQWFLMPDGKIAAAGNTTHPRCIRKQSCFGATVFDVADCYLAAAQTFRASETIAGNIESTRRLGPPLHGVVGPGSIHGPFQLYPSCDGLATPEGCIKESPPTGWTKLPSQYIGKTKFQHGEESKLDYVRTAQQVADGDLDGVTDALMDSGAENAAEAAGFELGLSRHEMDQCGTRLGEGDRSSSWWYFIRLPLV